MTEALELYKKKRARRLVVVFLFPAVNGLHGKKENMEYVWRYATMKTLNISGSMPLIFFILSPCVWENNGLLNKINGMILT